eukprot:TRINITY_DN10376_c0_g1_i3.p3 TRINITY_DN10376_c0_g1~~TRINITY_DN10376_c0_g1_i3.p3  ORF type:complete len:173 (-),score=25.98 TRINITY_DN10376_c0_g1_i3:220-738(-)
MLIDDDIFGEPSLSLGNDSTLSGKKKNRKKNKQGKLALKIRQASKEKSSSIEDGIQFNSLKEPLDQLTNNQQLRDGSITKSGSLKLGNLKIKLKPLTRQKADDSSQQELSYDMQVEQEGVVNGGNCSRNQERKTSGSDLVIGGDVVNSVDGKEKKGTSKPFKLKLKFGAKNS